MIQPSDYILVIHDDESGDDLVLHHLSLQLKSCGWKVQFEKSPVLWDRYSKILPRLIVIDILQPEIDGLYLMKEIQKEMGDENIPLLIISDLSSTAFDFGASDYLFRPVSPQELVRRVKDLLIFSGNNMKTKKSNRISDVMSTRPFISMNS